MKNAARFRRSRSGRLAAAARFAQSALSTVALAQVGDLTADQCSSSETCGHGVAVGDRRQGRMRRRRSFLTGSVSTEKA